MRFQFNQKIGTYALYTLGVICASIVFFFFVQNIEYFLKWGDKALTILGPFIWGFALAYLFLRPLKQIERLWDKLVFHGRKASLRRGLSIMTLLLAVGVFIYVVSSFVFPQLLSSVDTLRRNLPDYIASLQNMANHFFSTTGIGNDINKLITPYWSKILNASTEIFSSLFFFLLNSSVALTSKLLNVFLIFVVILYAMYGKERFAMQTKKLCYAFLPKKAVENLLFILGLIDDTFGRYVSGQLVDALVVGTMCVLSMLVLKLPYALLVGVIVACTNVIPMIGPIIGAIPGTFIILMAGQPLQAITFVVLILVIQQIDGNILVPRIVGGSTGVSGFWVLFAIMVGGGFFGLLGVVLCVPTISVVFKLLKIYAENRLRKKGLPVETESYRTLPEEAAGQE